MPTKDMIKYSYKELLQLNLTIKIDHFNRLTPLWNLVNLPQWGAPPRFGITYSERETKFKSR
jgi:hypothetical protein